MRPATLLAAARALLAALVLAAPGAASATVSIPPAVIEAAGPLQPLGAGKLRWFGFTIYEAALWVGPRGRQAVAEGGFALAIRYARSIPGAKLVATSIEEIARLGFGDESKRERWRSLLSRALPAVAPGETLVGLYLPGRGVRFWHEARPTAHIADEELARAFFAIWLDERTREPELRSRLLGEDSP